MHAATPKPAYPSAETERDGRAGWPPPSGRWGGSSNAPGGRGNAGFRLRGGGGGGGPARPRGNRCGLGDAQTPAGPAALRGPVQGRGRNPVPHAACRGDAFAPVPLKRSCKATACFPRYQCPLSPARHPQEPLQPPPTTSSLAAADSPSLQPRVSPYTAQKQEHGRRLLGSPPAAVRAHGRKKTEERACRSAALLLKNAVKLPRS